MSRSIVFTGPSLSPEEAQKILPGAWIHGPIKCGDILKVLRLHPSRLIIMDGYFEQTASVWHKEILFALALGVEVYGASSMGALRAAELEPFGMQGKGKVFEMFHHHRLTDDDEVSLVHESGFEHRVAAMCNIRATLEQAVNAGKLSPSEGESLLHTFKSLPYYERVFPESLPEESLREYCKAHYQDLKKMDALALLSELRDTPIQKIHHNTFVPTIFFYKIFREMAVTPFDHAYDWLNPLEKQLHSLQSRKGFAAISRLAKLFHLSYDLASQHTSLPPHREAILRWAQEMTLQSPTSTETWKHYLRVYDYQDLPPESIHETSILLIQGLLGTLSIRDLHLQPSCYQACANHFRMKHRLLTETSTLNFSKEQGLHDLQGFIDFMEQVTPLYHLVDLNNAHQLGIEPSLLPINWLKLALDPEWQLEWGFSAAAS